MAGWQEFREDSPEEPPVSGFVHGKIEAARDCLILTHGAGSNCESPLLVTLAEAFAQQGWAVLRCDLAFRQLRRQGPPPRGSAERDQSALRAAVAAVRRQTAGRVFLGGHSYGGRQASMLAADQPGLVDGLLLLSYPLHPPQRPGELRTAHFSRLQMPGLFVQGTRDGFGSIEELTAALRLIPAATELLPVPGAGHELLGKRNRDQAAQRITEAFESFVVRAADRGRAKLHPRLQEK
jgi:predicted alpha/beta-hydrolase family hydrolase